MKRLFCALSLIAGAAGGAHADNGVYAGVGLGQSQLNPDGSHIDFSRFNYHDRDEGYKIIAGIRPISLVGAEINYVDLGRTRGFGDTPGGPTSVRSDAQIVDAMAIGYIPLPFVDLFGKVGIARSWARYREEGVQNLKFNSTDFAWGGGVQAHFGSLAARLEYDRFNLPTARDAGLVSLGVTYTFF